MTKRVYIAYTGGTLGMARTSRGYAPVAGFLEEQLAGLPDWHSPELPEVVVNEYEPLLDSADMMPSDWLRIAHDIRDHYDDFDGFVVLHGTDTMAYTASALPFLLGGLTKPVVVTGSQIPLCELRNDARDNLITALLVAAREPIPEVCLCFGNRLLRGCRAVKVHASGLDAFDSPSHPPLGSVGIDVNIRWDLVRPAPPGPLEVAVNTLPEPPIIGALRLFPGFPAEILRSVTRTPAKGLVLEVYGLGNGPSRDKEFLAALREATERGVVIVAVTQCLSGGLRLASYATGAALAQAGVISGFDLTAEAALAKLFYLFASGMSSEEVKQAMQQNLRGELTERAPESL